MRTGIKYGARASRYPAAIRRHKKAVRILVGLFAAGPVAVMALYPWPVNRRRDGAVAKMASRSTSQPCDPQLGASLLT